MSAPGYLVVIYEGCNFLATFDPGMWYTVIVMARRRLVVSLVSKTSFSLGVLMHVDLSYLGPTRQIDMHCCKSQQTSCPPQN
jgi:hypothetical protein